MSYILEKEIAKTKLTIKDLKRLTAYFFDQKTEELKLDNIDLGYYILPHRPYGSMKTSYDFNNIKVKINLSRFRFSKEKTVKKIFNLYNNIIHELEHAKSFSKTVDSNFYDFEHLMVLLEYFGCSKRLNVNIRDGKARKLTNLLINSLNYNNYLFSTSEVKSRLIAYRESLDLFLPYLDEKSIQRIRQIIESLEFLNDNIEIMYNENRTPVSKFSTNLIDAQSIISKNPDFISRFGILKNIFHDDGRIKSIYEIYASINAQNKNMYDKLIINLFLTIKNDISAYFNDEEFKTYMEDLINRYNDNAVRYVKNMGIAKVFINDDKVLVKNLEKIKLNVLLLVELGNYYGLKRKSGLILDYSLGKGKNHIND